MARAWLLVAARLGCEDGPHSKAHKWHAPHSTHLGGDEGLGEAPAPMPRAVEGHPGPPGAARRRPPAPENQRSLFLARK
eukprot:5573605-Amphidinium_carterae.1